MNNDASKQEHTPVSFVFACSGAADVGSVSDSAARALAREKAASMCCTAAVAANVADIVQKVRSADRIVAIDGCQHHCVAKVLRDGGFSEFVHVDLAAMDMEKGKTPPTAENIARATDAARAACMER